MVSEEGVRTALRKVKDPELNLSIIDTSASSTRSRWMAAAMHVRWR